MKWYSPCSSKRKLGSVCVYSFAVEETRISPPLACAAIRDASTTLRPISCSGLPITKPECSANPDGHGPLVGRTGGERPLELDRRVQPGVRAVERGQEAVVLELHHLSVVAPDEPLDEQVVIAHELLPALRSELLGGRAGVGDVAEHQSDRAVR